MKRQTWTFPTTCKRGHLYGPNPPRDERGSRVCVQCRTPNLCAQCKLRPVSRKRSKFCSKACSNASRAIPLADRFLRYYQPGEPDACWLWTGAVDRNGYGVIGDEHRRQWRAHRVAYEREHGTIPDTVYVLHRCDNPTCVNYAHLWLGTAADNNEDKRLKHRQPFGSSHGRATITEDDVRDIRGMYPQMSQQAIATQYGLHQTTVSDIIHKRLWKHVV